MCSAWPIAPAASAPPPPEPVHFYKTATEQLLAMLRRPGEFVPPVPVAYGMNLRGDLKRALTNLIEIYETDDAHAVNRKETVAWLKVQLAEAETEGWDPVEFIKALEEQRREEAALRMDAERLLEDVRRENPGAAETAREALNDELLEKGILPIESRE